MIEFNLKKVVKQSGLTMQELSKKAGVSRTALSNLATGKSQGIQFDTLNRICEVLVQSAVFGHGPRGEERIIRKLISFKKGNNVYSFQGYYSLNGNINNSFLVQNDYLLVFKQDLFGASIIDTKILRLSLNKQINKSKQTLKAEIFSAVNGKIYNHILAKKLNDKENSYIASESGYTEYLSELGVHEFQNLMTKILFLVMKEKAYLQKEFMIFIDMNLKRENLSETEHQELENFIKENPNYPDKSNLFTPSDTWEFCFQITHKDDDTQVKPLEHGVYFDDPQEIEKSIKKNINFDKFKK